MDNRFVPSAKYQKPANNYGTNGCLQSSLSACGPKICWVCPHPNYVRNWGPEDRAKGVDQVRKNIYYGGVICDFKPRSEINDKLCNRLFLNSPVKPPYDYAGATETEFYLRHGESSSCSPFWRFRYSKNKEGEGKFQRIGPATY